MEKIYSKTNLLGAMLLLMLLAFAPGKAVADDLSSYYYTTEDGTAKQLSTSDYSFAKVESSTTEFSANTVYVVTEDVEISDRISCGAGVILVLLDGKTLKAQSGITVEGDNSITITSGGTSTTIAGTGYLIATTKVEYASYNDAGIGGTKENGAGSITINGGTVTAYSAQSGYEGNGAGIGGGYKGAGGTITINGGTVTAYSSSQSTGYGAGIGGGRSGDGGTITINGGTVTAYSSDSGYGYGAGIGGGSKGAGGSITINGGTVTAYSSEGSWGKGAGIGGGSYGDGDGGNITIKGGTVTAYSSYSGEGYGAGIGGGEAGIEGGEIGSGGTITIYGGTVTAYSPNNDDYGNGAGIGVGNDGTGGKLSILGDAIVEARGYNAIKCDEAKASKEGLEFKIEYGDDNVCVQGKEVNLLNFNDGTSLSKYKYAKISAAEKFYTVKFIDGESILKTRYVLPNSVVEPYEYTKEGYAFDGWYADAELKNLYDFDTPVTADINLYANMSKLLTVTFKDGETVVNEQIVHKDNTVTSYQYEKEGYNLNGWYADADLTKKFDFNVGITSDITLYAKMDPYKYTVIYTVNDSVMKVLNAEYDKAFSLPTPTKSGYTFAGWTASEVDDAAMSGASEDNLSSWDGTATTNSYFMNITKEEGAKVLFTAEWNEGGSSSEGDEGSNSFDLEVTSYGVATLYLDYAVKIPDDVIAVSYISDVTDDEMRQTKLTGYIPARTGVVVQANKGTYTFRETTATVESVTDSKLIGTLKDMPLSDITSGTVYTLGMGKTFVGFHIYNGDTLKANKAYYHDKDGNSARSFTLTTGNTTGIGEALQSEPTKIYDLNGICLGTDGTHLKKGIYIRNGKKMVIR